MFFLGGGVDGIRRVDSFSNPSQTYATSRPPADNVHQHQTHRSMPLARHVRLRAGKLRGCSLLWVAVHLNDTTLHLVGFFLIWAMQNQATKNATTDPVKNP